MTVYKYNGDGAGIPGLPFIISDADIAAFTDDQAQVFQAALASGAYLEQSDIKPSAISKTKKADKLTAEGD